MSISDILNYDTVIHVFNYLSDKEKIMLCSTCTYFRELLNKVITFGFFFRQEIKITFPKVLYI
ncbi:F-box protein [Megavirus baoshan]|uniref:F-box protein n=1 Tax=Megavirus baoshan TaxID=2496520 RepID=A0A8K1T0S3_9VIRU|nr:F-box protein [Megavirus baoshan]UFX99713.1 F-box protein [Megavirus baoshan]